MINIDEYGILDVGGVRSNDYGIYVLDVDDSDIPRRDYTSYSVPGRSRDIHYDNGRYENKDRTYKCVIKDDGVFHAEDLYNAFCARLVRLRGYQRIEDTLHPDYYKLGEFKGDVTPSWAKGKDGARFDLVFDCDSRKYLRSGEEEHNLGTGTKTIWNPGTEDASPVFTVTGNGYIEISNKRITITNNTDTMIIDCEIGDAYEATAHSNLNSKIRVSGTGDFPVLAPGSNSVRVNSLTSCIMIPRWVSL